MKKDIFLIGDDNIAKFIRLIVALAPVIKSPIWLILMLL